MDHNEAWWDRITRSESAEGLRDIILTGVKDGRPFTPLVPLCRLPQSFSQVLDFGCGLGRNFPYLKSVSSHVVGFDTPAMIERCHELASDQAHELTDNWALLATKSFDLIFTQLVLQHVSPAVVASRLIDFAKMAPLTYVLTRAWNDYGPRTLEIIGNTERFDVLECREVIYDNTTFQLRALDELPFEDACRRKTGHMELLLKPKARS